MMFYKHTHVSTVDRSPAMSLYSTRTQIVLMNEDGFIWVDPATRWTEIREGI
jgi:hypothetical protein